MKRPRQAGATNFWPGYVDALVNVVLNLLFMVAMFGMTLALFNNSQAVDFDQPPPGFPAVLSAERQVDRAVTPPIFGPAIADVAADQVQPELTAPAPLQTAGPSDQPGTNAPGQTIPVITIIDVYQRPPGPPARVKRKLLPGGSVLYEVLVPDGAEPADALAQPAVAALLRAGLPAMPGRIMMWTGAAISDPIEQRSAFIALAVVRNQLLANGLSAEAINARIFDGSSGSRSAQQIFVLIASAS